MTRNKKFDSIKVKGETISPEAIAEANTLNGLTATAAEINKLAGVTAGTATASKAVVLGTNKNLDALAIADGGFALGSGAGTAVTSTAAELNILDGVTKTAAQINTLVAGVAGGYKIARGVAVVDAATFDVATGLTTVVMATCSLVGDPTTSHMWSSATIGNQTNAPVAGSIRINSFKPTANDNVTPIAASGMFANVAWIAIGT